MRIVIDLQSCQAANRNRGIGRYSMELSKAVAKRAAAGGHEAWIVLNGLFYDGLEKLKEEFKELVPPSRIAVFQVPGPVFDADTANGLRRKAAEATREDFIARLNPGIVHVASLFEGFIDDAVTSVGSYEKIPTAVTLYDLIPLIFKENYLSGNEPHKEHYYRKLQSLKNADLLFAISENSKRDAIRLLGIPEGRVINISGAADKRFRRLGLNEEDEKRIKKAYGISKPFVMADGGLDFRKNVEGLLMSYAKVPSAVRKEHELVIFGNILAPDRKRLLSLAESAGIKSGEIIFTGYISDGELVKLYNLAKLFVYPSFYEGFGLPPLEAMSCGCPAIGSNASSIPEVIGFQDALFDPSDPASVSRKISEALTEGPFREALKEHALRHAKLFNWDECARRVISGYEEMLEKTMPSGAGAVTAAADSARFYFRRKPKLAFISPLPPEKSGISDYSAELLPDLARYYDIDLVVSQKEVGGEWLSANFPILGVGDFIKKAGSYDRTLYQMGNSTFHEHMVGLIEKYPGTLVMHDFYLSNLFSYLDNTGETKNLYEKALYYSHGYKGLICEAEDYERSILDYPANKWMLDHADGVIVHSKYSIGLAGKFYGRAMADIFYHIPQLRKFDGGFMDRREARKKLGLKDGDFIICSFGIMGPYKLNDRLLSAWLSSGFAAKENAFLVFVGENNPGDYGSELLKKIKASRCGKRIKITGFVDADTYDAYLSAADAAVQLRTNSRGETSRAVLDCLSRGIPVIVNANGSAAEYPDDAAIKIPDGFADAELVEALELIGNDEAKRKLFSKNSIEYIRNVSSPAKIAASYMDAIEKSAANGKHARAGRLAKRLASVMNQEGTGGDIKLAAEAVSLNYSSGNTRQILVDISELAKKDAGTGIQRVTRSITRELLIDPPESYRVEPVYLNGADDYRYARKFTCSLMGLPDGPFEDGRAEAFPGDIFLFLDLNPYILPSRRDYLSFLKKSRVRTYFVIHDILSVSRPEFFSEGHYKIFLDWLDIVFEYGDGAVCVSRASADDVYGWLEKARPRRENNFYIGYSHNGADIPENIPAKEARADGLEKRMPLISSAPAFLMVGTVEPRKGHAQTLAAFEMLWKKGVAVNLVIVGRQGWSVDETAGRLRGHAENGRRLFWFEDADDGMLVSLYGDCDALLMASEAEGFGLPIVEAAQRGLPVIARDIPVFREIAGERAVYFSGKSPDDIAAVIESWLSIKKSGKVPDALGMTWLTWRQSAGKMMDIILNGDWYKTWTPRQRD